MLWNVESSLQYIEVCFDRNNCVCYTTPLLLWISATQHHLSLSRNGLEIVRGASRKGRAPCRTISSELKWLGCMCEANQCRCGLKICPNLSLCTVRVLGVLFGLGRTLFFVLYMNLVIPIIWSIYWMLRHIQTHSLILQLTEAEPWWVGYMSVPLRSWDTGKSRQTYYSFTS